jgi:hypothetical protein
VTIGNTRFQSRDETRSHADHIGAQHLRCDDIAPRGNPTGELDDAVKYGGAVWDVRTDTGAHGFSLPEIRHSALLSL